MIFITEPLFAQCGEAIEQYKQESFPAIIPIPDSHGSTGVAMAQIKSNVEKAIGADILFHKERHMATKGTIIKVSGPLIVATAWRTCRCTTWCALVKKAYRRSYRASFRPRKYSGV